MEKPAAPNQYIGKQVIINSDRLLFNSKEDSILGFAKQHIGFSTNKTIHFDTSDSKRNSNFVVNSPNIYLGLYNDNLPTEPALLGDRTEDWLKKLLDLIEGIMNDVSIKVAYQVTSPGGLTAPYSGNLSMFNIRKRQIKFLKNRLDFIKSKKVKLS